MKLPSRFIALFLAGLAVPVLAADKAPAPAAPTPASPSLSDLGHAFKNALTEEETRLLIEYMRDSVLAAFKDEEVTLPPDLAFKLEVLMQRLKKQSNFYLDNWLKQLEADIKRSLKEKMEVPPPVPYTPPEVPLLVPAMKMPATPPAPSAHATQPAAAYVPPPTNFSPPPWGYVPWFYVPQPGNTAPTYTPPALPWSTPTAPVPAPAEANKAK
jgi:hypothetical protein